MKEPVTHAARYPRYTAMLWRPGWCILIVVLVVLFGYPVKYASAQIVASPDLIDNLTQIGVGGILALLIIREVLKFLTDRKTKPDNGSAGTKSVEFWQHQQRLAVRDVLTDLISPFLSAQTEILRRINESSDKTREGIQELVHHAIDQRERDRERKHEQ